MTQKHDRRHTGGESSPREHGMSVWDLNGRTALVTGGARGLGQATAEALARAGASVMIGDVLDELGAESAQLIAKDGATTGSTYLDVTDEASWEEAVAAT